jgi:SH3-like domain-containing protein
VLLFLLLCAAGCKHGGAVGTGDYMYVAAPQANLRDQVSTVYNRVGTVKNGDRVEVLERQKRFVRVRTDQKLEGWIELRALAPAETFEQFQRMAKENKATPVEGRGVTRSELNMHVAPGRETETLYQLAESTKVELLKRATAMRATPEEVAAKRAAAVAKAAGEAVKTPPKKQTAKPAQPSAPAPAPPAEPSSKAAVTPAPGEEKEQQPKPMDDWWLVRNSQGRVGWVLSRMIDIDIPLELVQYAEGQRIQAAFVLNTVQDADKGAVPQYLVLLNENHDGIPYDFNQVRVFTWNLKRHRYETGYREHFIIGYFPVGISNENFGKEGVEPVFTIRKQNEDGSITPRRYRLIGNVVRQVLAPGEQPQKAASSGEPKNAAGHAAKHQGKAHR